MDGNHCLLSGLSEAECVLFVRVRAQNQVHRRSVMSARSLCHSRINREGAVGGIPILSYQVVKGKL